MHGENDAGLEETHDPSSNSDHPFALQGSLQAEFMGSLPDSVKAIDRFTFLACADTV
jgi:hypothetical protein